MFWQNHKGTQFLLSCTYPSILSLCVYTIKTMVLEIISTQVILSRIVSSTWSFQQFFPECYAVYLAAISSEFISQNRTTWPVLQQSLPRGLWPLWMISSNRDFLSIKIMGNYWNQTRSLLAGTKGNSHWIGNQRRQNTGRVSVNRGTSGRQTQRMISWRIWLWVLGLEDTRILKGRSGSCCQGNNFKLVDEMWKSEGCLRYRK